MINYDYYINNFKGKKLTQDEFDSVVDMAKRYVLLAINKNADDCQIADGVCALCELYSDINSRQGIKSESIDGISVTYDNPKVDKDAFSLLKLYISPDLLYRGMV